MRKLIFALLFFCGYANAQQADILIKNGKLIIHNYGQGGAGWTFLFGCVNESIRLFQQKNINNPVCIIGAGCYGMLTAINLKLLGYNVKIIAKDILKDLSKNGEVEIKHIYQNAQNAHNNYSIFDIQDSKGQTALMYIIKTNTSVQYINICVRLLAPYSNINLQDIDGWTIIMLVSIITAYLGSEDILEFLLDNKFNTTFTKENSSFDKLTEKIFQSTKMYAKRQRTWNQKEVCHFKIDPSNSTQLKLLLEDILIFINLTH